MKGMPVLRILHTADVHLGATFGFLGAKGKEQREQLKATFSRVVGLAIDAQADLVVIAGDLFHNAYPGTSLLSEVACQLGRLDGEGIWTVIAPGTHDPWREGGIYENPALRSLPHVHVFREEDLTAFPIPGLDLVVYGAAWWGEKRDPLAGFRPHDEARFRIGVLHASVRQPGRVEEDDTFVDRSSIAGSGLHYLALGHWHSLADYSSGGVTAFYPGPPEPLGPESEAGGNVLIVELGEEGVVEVKPVRVGRRRFQRLDLDGAELAGPEDLYARLRSMADEDLALTVRIRRLWGESWMGVDWDEMEGDLTPLFFHLRLEVQAYPEESIRAEDYPENTVIGRFLRVAEREMSGLQGEDLQVAQEALRLGLFHLAGRGS